MQGAKLGESKVLGVGAMCTECPHAVKEGFLSLAYLRLHYWGAPKEIRQQVVSEAASAQTAQQRDGGGVLRGQGLGLLPDDLARVDRCSLRLTSMAVDWRCLPGENHHMQGHVASPERPLEDLFSPLGGTRSQKREGTFSMANTLRKYGLPD